MKYGVCAFSGHDIHKGKGRLMVLRNGMSFLLAKSKCRSHFLRGMNPKKLNWTLPSRINRKKAVAFKRSKVQAPKIVKSIRAFVGVSLEELKSKMAPEQPTSAPPTRFSKRDKIKKLANK